MLKEKAELIGFLCAEGNHHKYYSYYKEFDKRRGKAYNRKKLVHGIDFNNNNILIQKRFIRLLKISYNYNSKVRGDIKRQRIGITKRCIINNLLKYTDFGCQKWRIPEDIMNSSKQVKSAFLKGLFDGDGSLVSTKPKISFFTVNYPGLLQVSNLLYEFRIRHNSYTCKPRKNRKDCFYIQITNKENIIRFIKEIGSNKNKRLLDLYNKCS